MLRSALSAVFHRRQSNTDNAAWISAGQGLCMPVVEKYEVRCIHAALHVSFSTGLEVSPGYLLQNGIVQGQIGNELLEPGILLLQFLEPPCLLDAHPSVLP